MTTTDYSPLELRAVLGPYGHFEGLRSGEVAPEGVRLRFEDVPVNEAFRHMCRDLAYDVSEMSITGYLLARRYNKGLTALPVFPVRAFGQSHAAIAGGAGLMDPRAIEGRAVGARAYTGAASFWVRGVLATEYGVDVDSVTWVSVDEEHVLEYQQDAPPNAVYEIGADLERMFAGGRLAAVIGLSPPGSKPLLPAARYAAREWYTRTGVYQINHVIVVRDALLAEKPRLAEALYEAFVRAKQLWLDKTQERPVADELDLPDRDPLPYGVNANLASLETLLDFAARQRVLERRYTVAEMFPICFE